LFRDRALANLALDEISRKVQPRFEITVKDYFALHERNIKSSHTFLDTLGTLKPSRIVSVFSRSRSKLYLHWISAPVKNEGKSDSSYTFLGSLGTTKIYNIVFTILKLLL